MSSEEQARILKKGPATWNRWRAENKILRPELQYFDLSNADLAGADLSLADLEFANLDDADLTGANLLLANLHRASLRRANLTRTDLYFANLVATDLRGASLRATRFHGTAMGGAHFAGASLSSTLFAAVDLSSALGLDEVLHTAPSTIGLDTLYESAFSLPHSFLAGAEVPEQAITTLYKYLAESPRHYSCFISYSHEDSEFADAIYGALREHKIRCWLDKHAMQPGSNIYDEIARGIQTSDRMLLVCSEHSLTSWWVDSELTSIFDKERRLSQETKKNVALVVPLDLDGFMFSSDWKSGKKDILTSRLALRFSNWSGDTALFQKRIHELELSLRHHTDE